MKRKCIFCRKELDDYEEDLCETCLTFFEWKYKKKKKNLLNHIRKKHAKYKFKNKKSGGKK